MFQVGKIVLSEVVKIKKTYILVVLNQDNIKWTGIVNIFNISDYFIQDINKHFEVGQMVYLEVVEVNENENKLNLSFKSINPLFLRNPFEYKNKETKKGFKSLDLLNTMALEGEIW